MSDSIGLWYGFLDELGEDTRVRYVRLSPQNGHQEWHALSHKEFDGIGGFLHLLRQSNAGEYRRPFLQDRLRPRSFLEAPLQKLKSLYRALTYPPKHGVPWKRFEWSWKARRRMEGSSSALASHVFSPEETRGLLHSARRRRVTMNTLLMWTLQQAVPPLLVRRDEQGRLPKSLWMMPVNLHGAVGARKDTANQSSFLVLPLAEDQSLGEVHASIRQEMETGLHWFAWRAARWLPRISVRASRAKVRKDHQGAESPWLGAFSNLGAWRGKEVDDAWLFFPTATKVRPLGAGCLTWNGRLGLSLQAHPALSRDPNEVAEWIAAWARTLSEFLGQEGSRDLSSYSIRKSVRTHSGHR